MRRRSSASPMRHALPLVRPQGAWAVSPSGHLTPLADSPHGPDAPFVVRRPGLVLLAAVLLGTLGGAGSALHTLRTVGCAASDSFACADERAAPEARTSFGPALAPPPVR